MITTDMTALTVAALPVGTTAHLPGVDISRRQVAEWRFTSAQQVVTLSRSDRTWCVSDGHTTSAGLFDAVKLALAAV
jgi:hypothetical protein